ncbi:SAM-dependent methyltransferase [Saccharopolyspora lacisalsi]|uniref:SAM-dependent methyltransferase n=1 Tax=Halosaccharopolyspora lacisalsi TaxID=1000566 RepID=A0A839DUR8_9PSEU|nr:class I SAM-dependent methyltransferase [Halosaccharopolyspora lacisalsi]MBA8823025.1 SAM-dependent methyltransferase [Halosaccharopolyspora lacisalsi]
MHSHSSDGIDWDTRLRQLRETDALTAPETAALAEKLLLPADRTVVDIGSGAGGSAAALAAALPAGGVVTLVDSAPELLTAAVEHVHETAPGAEVRTAEVDAATDEVRTAAEPADLVFASFAVHHLPDQAAGIRRLSALVRPGGRLAIVEFGLPTRVLPWDVGLGAPGLEGRLAAAGDEWFRRMRADMPGATRLPTGWPAALTASGLERVHSWSYLIDRPAPLSGPALDVVVRRLEGMRETARTEGWNEDAEVVDQLLDVDGQHYVGHRDDVYYLTANTVHVGTRPRG